MSTIEPGKRMEAALGYSAKKQYLLKMEVNAMRQFKKKTARTLVIGIVFALLSVCTVSPGYAAAEGPHEGGSTSIGERQPAGGESEDPSGYTETGEGGWAKTEGGAADANEEPGQADGYEGTGGETALSTLAANENKAKATLNADQTSIRVEVAGIASATGISRVQFAVWGNKNGQNDLRWYTAKKEGDSYTLDIPVSNHKESGIYNIHAYAALTNGQNTFIGAADVTVAPLSGTVAVQGVDASTGIFTVKAENIMPAAASPSNVRVAVWSQADGQDDIRWYTMDASGRGYSKGINIANHKYGYGTYYAHVYASQKNGIDEFVGAATVTLAAPAAVVAASLDTGQTQISISAGNVIRPGVAKMQFAVWGNANGQNDLRWYNANRNGDNYSLSVPVKGHKEEGAYYIHAYATLAGGTSVFIGSASVTVTALSGKVTAPTKDDVAGTFAIEARDIAPASAFSGSARVAVWSANGGQDDLRWYTMDASGGAYRKVISIAGHNYGYGTYYAHVYATQKNGIEGFIGAAAVALSPPPSTITAALDPGQTGIAIAANSLVRSPGIKSVQFAVWGRAGGQNDLRWYTANKKGDNYSLNIPVQNHKETGIYDIHIYATLTSGHTSFIEAKAVTVEPLTGNVTTPAKNDSAGTFTVKAENIAPAAMLSGNVRVAVWSGANGQDDIRWYSMAKSGDAYTCSVNIKDHKYGYGVYNAHVYATQKNGADGFIGAATATLTPVPSVITAAVGSDEMQISIAANNVVRPGMSKVQFAVWGSKNGQNDIRCYNANKNGNNYSLSIPVKNHKEPGIYNIHVYGVFPDGQSSFIGAATCKVSDNPAGGAFSGLGSQSYYAYDSQIFFQESVINFTDSGDVGPSGTESVVFAVWSEANGQDDIEWVTGSIAGYEFISQTEWVDGAGYVVSGRYISRYSAILHTYRHGWHSGKYIVHAYRNSKNGVSSFLAGTTVEVQSRQKPGGAAALIAAARGYVGRTDMSCSTLVGKALYDIGYPGYERPFQGRRWMYSDWRTWTGPVAGRQPGDILITYTPYYHEEIYLGNGMSVHGGYGKNEETVVISTSTPTASEFRRLLYS